LPIYMKYGDIKGDVTAKGHEGWINLQSCQLGANSATGSRGSGALNVSEIFVTKDADCASTDLFRASLFGEGKTAKIDFVKSKDGGDEVYLTMTLTNTLITSYSVSGHGGDSGQRPMESLSMNFSKIEYGYHTASTPLQGRPPVHHLYATP
jgi:type VI secretion system secreted protein Hcp